MPPPRKLKLGTSRRHDERDAPYDPDEILRDPQDILLEAAQDYPEDDDDGYTLNDEE